MNSEEEIPDVVVIESGGKYWIRDEGKRTFTEIQLDHNDENFRNVPLDKAVKRIFKK